MFTIRKKWFLTKRIILCQINTVSGWGKETFYLDTKNNNFRLSTIHLDSVENYKIQHDRNCKFNINYRNVFLYDIKTQKKVAYLQLKH